MIVAVNVTTASVGAIVVCVASTVIVFSNK